MKVRKIRFVLFSCNFARLLPPTSIRQPRAFWSEHDAIKQKIAETGSHTSSFFEQFSLIAAHKRSGEAVVLSGLARIMSAMGAETTRTSPFDWLLSAPAKEADWDSLFVEQ